MVRHQLEPRRDVFRIGRKLPFEPSYIGLLEFEDPTQRLRVPWAKHGRRRLLRCELRGCQSRQHCETDDHSPSVGLRAINNARRRALSYNNPTPIGNVDVQPTEPSSRLLPPPGLRG